MRKGKIGVRVMIAFALAGVTALVVLVVIANGVDNISQAALSGLLD
jgi:hypothetical protein